MPQFLLFYADRSRYVQLLSLILVWSAFTTCQSSDPFANCQYGRPTPIFASKHPQITQHNFHIQQMEGIEQISFSNGVRLEISQKGCDNIVQLFTFELPGQYTSDSTSAWIDSAVQQFLYLSQLDEQYIPLEMWAQSIDAVRTQIKIGQKVEVEPGFLVEINRITSTDYAILSVEFSKGTVE